MINQLGLIVLIGILLIYYLTFEEGWTTAKIYSNSLHTTVQLYLAQHG